MEPWGSPWRVNAGWLLDTGEGPDAVELLGRLAESVDALDSWLSRGGFLPAAWRVPGGASR